MHGYGHGSGGRGMQQIFRFKFTLSSLSEQQAQGHEHGPPFGKIVLASAGIQREDLIGEAAVRSLYRFLKLHVDHPEIAADARSPPSSANVREPQALVDPRGSTTSTVGSRR